MDYKAMTEKWIRDFTNLLYNAEDKVAILLVNSSTNEREQMIIDIQNLQDKINYLRYMNANGYNVYISINRLKEEAKSRKKENFQEKQRTIYLDFDSKKEKASVMFRKLYTEIRLKKLPEPSMIVKSSTGNYQIYWTFEEAIPFIYLQEIMKKLNQLFSLDYTHDIARVFRLVGFRNLKIGKDNLVMFPFNNQLKIGNIEIKSTFQRYDINILRKIYRIYVKNEKNIILEEHYQDFFENKHYKSQSEMDMAFAIRMLSMNINEDDLISFLEERRKDKKTPRYYAETTVRKALAFLEKDNDMKDNDINHLNIDF